MTPLHPRRPRRKRRNPVLKAVWRILENLLAAQPLLLDLEAAHPEFRQPGASVPAQIHIPPPPDASELPVAELVAWTSILAQEKILKLLQTVDYSQAFPILPTCQTQTR